MSELNYKTLINRDYFTTAVVVTIVLMWLACLISLIFTWAINFYPELGIIFFILSIIVSVLGLPYIYKRAKFFNRLLKDGILVEAIFFDFRAYSDHVRVRYDYDYHGKTHKGNLHVASLTYGQFFKSGHKLNVLIDPLEPSRSVTLDLFLLNEI
jgi:hypothetical protein